MAENNRDKTLNKRILLLSCLVGGALICSLLLMVLKKTSLSGSGDSSAKIAKIYSGGELIKAIDLSSADDSEFDIISENGGFNTIHIHSKDICVSAASCPDGLCIKEGYALTSPVPIVCLPNKLVIIISNKESKEDSYDAVTY